MRLHQRRLGPSIDSCDTFVSLFFHVRDAFPAMLVAFSMGALWLLSRLLSPRLNF